MPTARISKGGREKRKEKMKTNSFKLENKKF
jgi:hypothetical protein